MTIGDFRVGMSKNTGTNCFLVRGGAFTGVWLSWREWAKHKFAQLSFSCFVKFLKNLFV